MEFYEKQYKIRQMGEGITKRQLTETEEALIDARLAKTTEEERKAKRDTEVTTKLIPAFKRVVKQGKETVKTWIMENRGGDAQLLKILEECTAELLGNEADPKYGTNNFYWMLPTGDLLKRKSYFPEKRGPKNAPVRKSGWLEVVVVGYKTLDSPLDTGSPQQSDRWRKGTFRTLMADIEEGLNALGLNELLNRFNRINRLTQDTGGLDPYVYHQITVPLLLYLRIVHGYTESELTK